MKRIISVILCAAILISILCTMSFAASVHQENIADAMNGLGLFLGAGDSGYLLDRQLRRSDGITLLVRMLGKEKTASSDEFSHPFTDVPQWLEKYVAYAYCSRLTKGVSGKLFGTVSDMTEAQFLTLTLRALGYSDSGNKAQFSWDSPYTLAHAIGLIEDETVKKTFTRGDAIEVFWNAMSCFVQSEKMTLREKLMKDGCFTSAQLRAAEKTVNVVSLTRAEKGGSFVEKEDEPELPEPEPQMSWEAYQALSAEDKTAYYRSFTDTNAYFDWYKSAWSEYQQKQQKPEIIGKDNTVDLS